MDFKLRGKEQVADLKLIADALFANGVNQVVWHGMPFNPVGIDTIMFYASVHVGKKGKLSKDIAGFNEYMGRVSRYMKKGSTYSDVAIYLPVEDSWVTCKMKNPDPQQPWAWGEYEMRRTVPPSELKGYNPVWISGDFLKNGKVVNSKLVCGDGAFSLLYIDADHIDIDALKTIVSLAKQGLPVCMKKIPTQPGKNKSPEYAKLLKELTPLKNFRREFKTISLPEPLLTGENLPDFWCRKEGGDYYFFLANPNAQDLHLPLKYGQSLSNSSINKQVVFNVSGHIVSMNLEFRPYQSLLIKIDQNGSPAMIDISYDPPAPLTK